MPVAVMFKKNRGKAWIKVFKSARTAARGRAGIVKKTENSFLATTEKIKPAFRALKDLNKKGSKRMKEALLYAKRRGINKRRKYY